MTLVSVYRPKRRVGVGMERLLKFTHEVERLSDVLPPRCVGGTIHHHRNVLCPTFSDRVTIGNLL